MSNSPASTRALTVRSGTGYTKSFDSLHLQQIPSIDPTKHRISELRLSNNPITSLKGLVTIESMTSLKLDNTKLQNFQDAQPQPGLRTISFQKTPLAMYQTYKLMAIIVFGDNLELVNGNPVKPIDKKKARVVRDKVLSYLLKGWILTSLSPLRIYNVATKTRRIIYVSQQINEELLDISKKDAPQSPTKSVTQENEEESSDSIDDLPPPPKQAPPPPKKTTATVVTPPKKEEAKPEKIDEETKEIEEEVVEEMLNQTEEKDTSPEEEEIYNFSDHEEEQPVPEIPAEEPKPEVHIEESKPEEKPEEIIINKEEEPVPEQPQEEETAPEPPIEEVHEPEQIADEHEPETQNVGDDDDEIGFNIPEEEDFGENNQIVTDETSPADAIQQDMEDSSLNNLLNEMEADNDGNATNEGDSKDIEDSKDFDDLLNDLET